MKNLEGGTLSGADLLVDDGGRFWEELVRRGQALIVEAADRVRVGQTIDHTWLAGALPLLADAAVGGWETLVGPLPRERSYRRIVASADFEAWLIFWPEGRRLELHDHGGASGAFQVVAGALDEHYLLGGVPPVQRRRIPTGGRVSFDGTYVHDVANASLAGATSVHVYSAPERTMTFYDLDGPVLRPLSIASDEAEIVEPRAGSSRRDLLAYNI